MKNRILLFDVLNSTMNVIKEKHPGTFLPFKGDFPLLNPGKEQLFNIGCEGKMYLDECDDWIQQILIKAQRIVDIDTAFFEFLKEDGLDKTYAKLSKKDKISEIKRFLDSTILEPGDLIIKEGEYGKL